MGQLQDSMYREFNLRVRDVTAAQFAAQATGAPADPGIAYRVDGALYLWGDFGWISYVTGGNVIGVTYDGSNRVTGYTKGGIAHVVTYPDATHIVDTGGDGRVTTVTLDGSGRVVSSVTV